MSLNPKESCTVALATAVSCNTQLKSHIAIGWWEGSLGEIGYFGNTAEKYRNTRGINTPPPSTGCQGRDGTNEQFEEWWRNVTAEHYWNDRKKCNVVEGTGLGTCDHPGIGVVVGITATTGGERSPSARPLCHSWWCCPGQANHARQAVDVIHGATMHVGLSVC